MIALTPQSAAPVLMAAENSAGGVMGKMLAAQSIIVACAAVGEEGEEGNVFRAVLPHSITLAAMVGVIVIRPERPARRTPDGAALELKICYAHR